MKYEEEIQEDDLGEVPVSTWRRVLQIIAGSIFIIAILYFSGIYQYFLFSKTPEEASPQKFEQIVSGEKLKVPAAFYVIDAMGRSGEEVRELSDKSSAILDQAGISIEVKDIHGIKLEDADILNAADDTAFLENLPSYDPDVVTIILSKSLFGLNGVAYGSGGVVVVAEYTTGFDFRTLAHEIGHILGLRHTQDPARLMNSGGRGEKLSKEEALTMRDSASKFGRDVLK